MCRMNYFKTSSRRYDKIYESLCVLKVSAALRTSAEVSCSTVLVFLNGSRLSSMRPCRRSSYPDGNSVFVKLARFVSVASSLCTLCKIVNVL